MTFDEAEKELQELADGNHCAIQYERMTFSKAPQEAKCMVYINDLGWFAGMTFREALCHLKRRMGINAVHDTSIGIDDSVTYGEGAKS